MGSWFFLLLCSYPLQKKQVRDKGSGFPSNQESSVLMMYVFNPFSLINALADSDLRNYWASSGATSLLPKFVDDMEIRLKDFDNCALLSTIIETSDVTGGGPELFLYQSGYLTIKGYMNGTYLLGIPNFEVKQALSEIVLPTLAMRKSNDIQSTQAFLNLHLSVGNLPEAMKCLRHSLRMCHTATRSLPVWIWRSATA